MSSSEDHASLVTPAQRTPPKRSRKPRKRLLESPPPTPGKIVKTCQFCHTSKQPHDDLLQYQDVTAHYCCLLFSSGLHQQGDEEQELRGFLLEDVKKEIRRGNKLKCHYCKQRGATVGCAKSTCKKSYHLPCGAANMALHQHYDQFKSFCSQHRPPMKALPAGHKGKECGICRQKLGGTTEDAKYKHLFCPCCKQGFHRHCLQDMAFSFGSDMFRCPRQTCRDSRKFSKEMQYYGIRVPDKKSLWEREEGEEQIPILKKCDAKFCMCTKSGGRTYNEAGTVWEIFSCGICNTKGIHSKCGGLEKYVDPLWYCYQCRRVVRTGEEEQQKQIHRPMALPWGRAKRVSRGETIMSKEETIKDINQSHYPSLSDHLKSLPTAAEQENLVKAAKSASKSKDNVSITNQPSRLNASTNGRDNLTLEDIIKQSLNRPMACKQPVPLQQQRQQQRQPHQPPPGAKPNEEEASPGDSDYESAQEGSNGSGQHSHNTAAQGPGEAERQPSVNGDESEVPRKKLRQDEQRLSFDENVQNSIKNYFKEDD